jgi:nitrogen fixation/metabolism regulation signal transduction histidine kinase
MNRLRNRLILVFLAATIIPLIVTLFIMTSLLERSLRFATTDELDQLSRSLEEIGREYYQQARESLRRDVAAGITPSRIFVEANRPEWPAEVVEFWESTEAERFTTAGKRGDRLDYLVRQTGEVRLFTRPFGRLQMERLTEQYREARALVEVSQARDLRRGFFTTLILLVAAVWLVSFGWLIYVATRMSQPIQRLTSGLSDLASGNLQTRIDIQRNDELGRAITAFNHTAAELQQSQERLVYLTQVASWQALARKMAHELKNSLTPIRLTVEEILARQPNAGRKFMEQAVQIVVDEIETLERRVRAFSEFSSEPIANLQAVDINGLLEERVSFLKPGHPGVSYQLELDTSLPMANTDRDHMKGILTNLLENAADAAGTGGTVLGRTYASNGHLHLEVHDSGPGLTDEASRTLFEPTITFKKQGMGLGLSIARKNALLCGGDLMLVEGDLRGAAFRLVLQEFGQ